MVSFYGSPEKMQAVEKYFAELAAITKVVNCRQLPGVSVKGEWLFDIRWEEDVFYFESSWNPLMNVLKQVADYFTVDFECEFEKLEEFIFGVAIYKRGNYQEIRLEKEDFSKGVFDLQNDCYLFEGMSYECKQDVLELLLDRKRNLFYGI